MTNHTSMDAEFIGPCFELYLDMNRPLCRTVEMKNRTPLKQIRLKTDSFVVALLSGHEWRHMPYRWTQNFMEHLLIIFSGLSGLLGGRYCPKSGRRSKNMNLDILHTVGRTLLWRLFLSYFQDRPDHWPDARVQKLDSGQKIWIMTFYIPLDAEFYWAGF